MTVSAAALLSSDKGSVLERVSERARATGVPFSALFEVTHRCNLPCTHCYLNDHEDHGELSFDEVVGVLDQLAAAGTVFLSLTGGEVLSRRDFLEIVDAAAARGFAVKVLTNATLVTDEVADRFAKAGVIEVSVSVYGGDAETHDRVTNMPGSFARTMAGIGRLRAHGIHVVLKTPVLTHNEQGARDVHQLAQLHAMPCSFELAISPKNNGEGGPLALMLHQNEMVRLLSDAELGPELAGGSEAGPEPCNAGRSFVSIGPTGDVQPCIMMQVVVGNVRRADFGALWREAPFFARLRDLEKSDLTSCTSCEVRGGCSRCPGVAMTRGQDVTGCDLSAKQVAKARVEARRRLPVVP